MLSLHCSFIDAAQLNGQTPDSVRLHASSEGRSGPPVNLAARIGVIASADSNYVLELRHQWAKKANNQYTFADTDLIWAYKVDVTVTAGTVICGFLSRNHDVAFTS